MILNVECTRNVKDAGKGCEVCGIIECATKGNVGYIMQVVLKIEGR